MSNLVAPIYDFKAGVLSKKLLGRQDLKLLKSGILQGENFITKVQGPQFFRPGFQYIRRSRNNLPAQLWQFVFNDDQAFVLEFTDYYLRFYSQEGIITETAKNITGLTAANPGVITSASHGYASGDEIFISGIVGPDSLNGQFYKVVYINANTYSLTDLDGNVIDTTALTAYSSGGTTKRVYQISTPYTKVQAESLKLAGTADVRYLVDGVHMPRKLTRLSNTSWTLTTYVRTNDPLDQIAITAATKANPCAITTGAAHNLTTGDEVYIEDITGMTELNNRYFVVTVTGANTFTLNGENSSAYTAYVSGGYMSLAGNAPRAVGLFGAALFLGGADNDPDVFHMSRHPSTSTGAPRYDDFTVGSAPEDAITLPISALGESVARIRWFAGTRSFLSVGMYGGMAKINGGQDSVPITNVDIGTFPIDGFGVADITPVLFGNEILYVQRGETNIMSFAYSLQNDGYESVETMLQSDELALSGVRQLVFQQGRPSLVWAVLNNGKLLSLTYRRTENVVAWNTHTLGGCLDSDEGVISAASEPQSSQKDRLWVCVKRRIDGIVRYMIEVSADNDDIPQFENFYTGDYDSDRQRYLDMLWETQRRLIHMDSALVLDTTQTTTITPAATTGDDVTFTAGASIFSADDIGREIRVKYLVGEEQGIAEIVEYVSATQVKCQIQQAFASTAAIPSGSWYFTQNTISGLGHLEGEEVVVLEDGAASEPKTVEDGEITLDDQVCVAIAGLGYTGIVETMPIDLLLSVGVTTGKYKTLGIAKVLFRDTLGVKHGNDIYDAANMKFRTGGDIAGRPAPLFSGWKELPAFDDYSIFKTYKFVQSRPLPCEIQALALDMEVPIES